MKVRCIKNRSDARIHALTPRAEYEVIGIEADMYRILNDDGDPCLYPPQIFRVLDARRPKHWVSEKHDGAEYAYTRALGRLGFFEDYFDRKPAARRTFHRYLNRHMRLTDAECGR